MVSSATMGRIALLCALLAGSAASIPAARPALVWVEVPGLRAQRVEALAERGALPWLGERIGRGDLHRLSRGEAGRVDSLRAAIRRLPTRHVDLGWEDFPCEGEPVLSLAGTVREARLWVEEEHEPSSELLSAWRGPFDWQEIGRTAGIDGSIRWEEIDEFLSLAAAQSGILRAMPAAGSHPLQRLRRAFSADKLFSNLALYHGRRFGAPRVFLRLDLARLFAEETLPWTEALLEAAGEEPAGRHRADRIFLLRRVRSSEPRVYARIDRILQSLAVEWRGEGIVLVDASLSDDPFVAVSEAAERGPGSGPGAGADPASRLAVLLRRAGWTAGSGP